MSTTKKQLGGYLPAAAKLSVRDRLRLFREAGFSFVALSAGGIYATAESAVTPRLAEHYGLQIDNVHLTGAATNQLWRDCLEGEDVLDRYCREIELCAKMGIKIGITHVTWGSHAPTPEITDLGIERFKRIAACAEQNDFDRSVECEPHERTAFTASVHASGKSPPMPSNTSVGAISTNLPPTEMRVTMSGNTLSSLPMTV